MAKPVDNPIDTGIDLGFVNFIKHPSDPSYVVFRFKDEKRADYFVLDSIHFLMGYNFV